MLHDRAELDAILKAAWQSLESCDCDDGCTSCCGGMGTLPEESSDEGLAWLQGYDKNLDAVSRAGAYVLICSAAGVPL